jgi:uncharacterized protein
MTLFADTFYFLAFLNRNDRAHSVATKYNPGSSSILTTEWVLTEVADAMAERSKRQLFLRLYRTLTTNPQIRIVKSDPSLFERGITRFSLRPDKEWSLTDCISFVVMDDFAISEALTGDHHFEQAGFRALLK